MHVQHVQYVYSSAVYCSVLQCIVVVYCMLLYTVCTGLLYILSTLDQVHDGSASTFFVMDTVRVTSTSRVVSAVHTVVQCIQ